MTAATETVDQRASLVLDGARGVIEHGELEILVRGSGRDVVAIWLRGGAYCDDRTMGRQWLQSRVDRAVDAGGDVRVGDETWHKRYREGRFR